jgi:hypothetical protein
MRRVLLTVAVMLGLLTFSPAAQALTGADAVSGALAVSKPDLSCPRDAAGVGAQVTPNPTNPDAVVCVYPTADHGYVFHVNLLDRPGSGWGYNWLDVGVGGGACERTAPDHYTCAGASTGGYLRIDPDTEGGMYFGGASACTGTDASLFGTCVFTLDYLFVDGPSGSSMGVGVGNFVCTQGDSGGLYCLPGALGLPYGATVDLTPQRDLVLGIRDWEREVYCDLVCEYGSGGAEIRFG